MKGFGRGKKRGRVKGAGIENLSLNSPGAAACDPAEGASARDAAEGVAARAVEGASAGAVFAPAGDAGVRITEDGIRQVLRPVTDPEIGISILDLGLVYGIAIDQGAGAVTITMTLTSQMCPMGPQILAATEMAARRAPGVRKVTIELVWEPPWDPRKHATDDGKAYLGIWN